jgi:hypothetical protein
VRTAQTANKKESKDRFMVHLHMTPIGESKSLARSLVGENRFKV